MDKVEKALKDVQVPGYWGSLELDVADGQITVIRKVETTKLTTRRGAIRDDQQENRNK